MRESVEPAKILSEELVTDPEFVVSIDKIETPVTTAFDRPAFEHSASELFDPHGQTAEEMG